jgi:hypothetical protein
MAVHRRRSVELVPTRLLNFMLDLMKAERKVWGRFASNSART